ncbi:RNA recognition motif domain-containing protein [Cinnamomum micranthum f. kanehirae]|uniref:RNA recognition motif domain-containing protein n=1 Tax=Cinnamomum micranthum f. kanehirae TaxID=337451 RepID=A0A443NCD6_9MAGN|nr:RNA recognition motif domain-containing protein [Cinnamomum micranthum f. kanehirae]
MVASMEGWETEFADANQGRNRCRREKIALPRLCLVSVSLRSKAPVLGYPPQQIRPLSLSRMRNCAFVDFKDAAIASQAQSQLNRLRFLGKVLSVERAGKALSDNKNRESEGQLAKDSSSSAASLLKGTPITGNVAKGNNPGSEPISEPIAPRLGVDYQFPPHLECVFFCLNLFVSYTIINLEQMVLHLMNKMNIPAPFRMALPTPPLPPSQPAPPVPPPPPPQAAVRHHLEDLSSDESELESSEEDDANNKDNSGLRSRKRTKREAIVGPAVDKSVPHEAVGVKPATLVPKEIPLIKKKNPVMQIKIAPKPMQSEVVDDDTTMEEVGEPAKEDLELKPYATPQEIEGGRLPPEEILSLPMFKELSLGNGLGRIDCSDLKPVVGLLLTVEPI